MTIIGTLHEYAKLKYICPQSSENILKALRTDPLTLLSMHACYLHLGTKSTFISGGTRRNNLN